MRPASTIVAPRPTAVTAIMMTEAIFLLDHPAAVGGVISVRGCMVSIAGSSCVSNMGSVGITGACVRDVPAIGVEGVEWLGSVDSTIGAGGMAGSVGVGTIGFNGLGVSGDGVSIKIE